MDLSPEIIEAKVEEYPEIQPLAAVEAEHIDLLPDVLERGDYGWRDPEWIVQWYYRRFLGAYPDTERRATEDAYDENTYERVHTAIADAIEAEDLTDKLRHLTALEGVDVAVGSAFLQFINPTEYVVVGERTWSVLHEAGELETDYPDTPTVPEYERYLGRCQRLSKRFDCSLWDLYRAIWVLGQD